MSAIKFTTAAQVEEAADDRFEQLYRNLADDFGDDPYEYQKNEARGLKVLDDWWQEARAGLPEAEQRILAANNGEAVSE